MIELWQKAWHHVISYALKFGAVGLVGVVVDVAIFNALRLGVLGADHGLAGPLGAKVASASIAIMVTWLGNRYWTFRSHRRSSTLSEFVEFVAVALVGMGVSLACLAISHYALGFTSLVADNIASNVIGLGLGTLVRFVLYRYWVYRPARTLAPAAELGGAR